MIRLIIISDIRFYREGLAKVLEMQGTVNVVATADNSRQAVEQIIKYSPDVVLLDMIMVSSCETVSNIMSACPDVKIVALAVNDHEDSILTCARAGIAGYLSRGASIEQVYDALNDVVEGKFYCPSEIAESLIHKFKSHEAINDTELVYRDKAALKKEIPLTQREKQIASLLSNGLSNKQIARNLTIEVSTVKNHVHNILSKMGAHSRIQAVNILQHQFPID